VSIAFGSCTSPAMPWPTPARTVGAAGGRRLHRHRLRPERRRGRHAAAAQGRRPAPADAAQAGRPDGRERDRRAGLHDLPAGPPHQAALHPPTRPSASTARSSGAPMSSASSRTSRRSPAWSGPSCSSRQNDEGAVRRARHMTPGTIAPRGDNPTVGLPPLAARPIRPCRTSRRPTPATPLPGTRPWILTRAEDLSQQGPQHHDSKAPDLGRVQAATIARHRPWL
jgi:hypothetical protein